FIDGNNYTSHAEKVVVLSEYRSTIIQILGGFAIAATLVFNYRRSAAMEKTVKISEAGQVTDRFAKAIELLGNDSIESKIGAIYALEKIAKDSYSYHWNIMEILAAFIRSNSPTEAYRSNGVNYDYFKEAVTSALIVIARRNILLDEKGKKLDISKVSLSGLKIDKGDFTNLNFSFCDIYQVSFQSCNFMDMTFRNCDLSTCRFSGSTFKNSTFSGVGMRFCRMDKVVYEDVSFLDIFIESTIIKQATFIRPEFVDSTLQLSLNSLKNMKMVSPSIENSYLRGKRISEIGMLMGWDENLIDEENEIEEPPF
ncbi:MAG: pentapeptide repeat-containing protein, partial [Bacteroidota bacterium]